VLPEWLENAATIGISAGASAPPRLVDEMVETLRALGSVEVEERSVAVEDLTFAMPRGVAD
jgi:4-hydroxy-3-methylbut-2-enyl diphosphate reductase